MNSLAVFLPGQVHAWSPGLTNEFTLGTPVSTKTQTIIKQTLHGA